MMSPSPSDRDLLLVGGGHTHALLIRRLAMKPLPGVRTTLVSDGSLTPYSGMLPGLVAGHYTFAETHIDLQQLCRKAGVRFINARMTGLDPDTRQISVDGQPPLHYDALSLDTGSTPNLDLPGAAEHATGVKPVSDFYQAWQSLLQADTPGDWGVVGAGAGGVELVLAMAWRLGRRDDIRLHLIYPGQTILKGYPKRVVRAAQAQLERLGVICHPGFAVSRVTADGLVSDTGEHLPLDNSILCTPAAPPTWPQKAGLDTANGGFVAVNEYLQSTSHSTVFAAGDVAEMIHSPRPKAGVYAVRQAPTLHHNLRHFFAHTTMEPVSLQKQFLSLLSLGDQSAAGHRNGLAFSGRWVWRWKDRIDRQFMAALNDFQPPTGMTPEDGQEHAPMHCAGCGSKLGPETLHNVLDALPRHSNPRVQPALSQAEDALLWRPTPGTLSVQSVDGFRAFSDDLYRLGQVCVHHALSDLYAMGATPVSAQVWVNLAFNHPRLQQRDFQRLMAGMAEALVVSECTLGGGHSTEGQETHVSVTANGEVNPDALWRKTGAEAGDWLVLTKPLGTGVILAADMAGAAPAEAMDAAWSSMLRSNGDAMGDLTQLNPHAVTDVTGFGLLGHLLEMLDGTALQAVLAAESIPVLPGAMDLLAMGWQSSLVPQLGHLFNRCQVDRDVADPLTRLLLDPQTSGGLLAAVPDIEALPERYRVIGRIQPAAATQAPVRLLQTSR